MRARDDRPSSNVKNLTVVGIIQQATPTIWPILNRTHFAWYGKIRVALAWDRSPKGAQRHPNGEEITLFTCQ
jgi:hypothetical protein